ncbi:MAG: glycogen-binding domain-containing protein [Verrucomicrobiota bacterium]
MSICACADREDLIRVPFSLHRPGARSVFLAFFLDHAQAAPRPHADYDLPRRYDDDEPATASDFLPLRPTKAGRWHVEVPLLPGWYEYAFLVDGEWMQDPAAPEVCPDGIGGHNSVRTITRPAQPLRFPAPAAAKPLRHGPTGLRRAV